MNVIKYPHYCPNCRLRYDDWEFDYLIDANRAVITMQDILESDLTGLPIPIWTCSHSAGCGLTYQGRFVLYYNEDVLSSWEIIQPEFNPNKLNAASQSAVDFSNR